MDFTKNIDKILEILSINQSALASKLGVSKGVVSEFASGAREPSKDFLFGLSKIGISLDWFLTGEGDIFLSHESKGSVEEPLQNAPQVGLKPLPVYRNSDIPEGSFVVPLLYQKLSAGEGTFLPEEDEARALIHVPSYLSRYGKNLAALTVEGDSMYPTLDRGDTVVCDSFGWSGEGIYALRIGGDGFVKRLTKAPGKLVIISDNPKYPIREEPEGSQDFEIIGRVHCAIKNME